ncbi:DUF423 domain-containing protein [Ornithobacterium rhinotracheale]|uniref:DUF423 domain-containing protein n=1 Tax=Ornithobacterium rhinotracheale TaxID=28251 RepID=A0A410JR08_ORNRH|nr:DUF423 domain-containing protein [Ornithobacterium rhinotracheale]QAR30511.1 DUF423 domain-containing protein [Ornithobacterium rhinotracheale]
MKQITLIIGAAYGMASIILGAFGAHAFKKLLPAEKLASFEIGVRYMMYHALLLLILGFCLNFKTRLECSATGLMMLGCLMFSGSIYFLAFSEQLAVPTRVLGPITPIGGALMILGWGLLLWHLIKTKF